MVLPALRQAALGDAREIGRLGGVRLAVGGAPGLPVVARRAPASAQLVGPCRDLVGHEEARVIGPSVRPLGRGHLVGAERRAVRRRRVLLVGRSEPDVGAARDQGRAPVGRRGLGHGGVDRLEVVAVVHHEHPPAVGREAGGHVLVEREARRAIEADAVVVPDPDQLLEAEESGDRGGLVRDALHEIAVGADEPRAVVDDLVAGAVVPGGQHRLGEGEPDRVGETLTERTGGDLDARGVAPFGVAGRLGAELAEAPELLDGQVVAAQVQQRVQEHRRVTRREHEPVALGPRRVGRVVTQVLREERPPDRRQPHGSAGVSAVRLLDAVDRQRADGRDGQFRRCERRGHGAAPSGISS